MACKQVYGLENKNISGLNIVNKGKGGIGNNQSIGFKIEQVAK